jgi:hypothetical protein
MVGAAVEGSHSPADASLAESEELQTRYPLDANAVIAAAFKAADLPVPDIPAVHPGETTARCTRLDRRERPEGRRTGTNAALTLAVDSPNSSVSNII